MAIFYGTNGADRILRESLTPGVTTDPAGLTGTLTGDMNFVYGYGGADLIEAGNLIDPEYFDAGDYVYGGDGKDTIIGGGGYDNLYGDAGDDVIYGGGYEGYSDAVFGGAGNDLICGFENDDNFLYGGAGVDTMIGGANNDYFDVNNAGDVIKDVNNGGYENVALSIENYVMPDFLEDVEYGITLDFSIKGNSLDNYIITSDGNDTVYGNEGNDTLSSFGGHDKLYGGDGQDTFDLYYSEGTCVIYGGAGSDWFFGSTTSLAQAYGGSGNDTLEAGIGRDVLVGGSGNDVLRGEGEADNLFGGKGADTFTFVEVSDSTPTRRDIIKASADAAAFEGAGSARGDLEHFRINPARSLSL